MMELLQQYKILEYIVGGAFGVGVIIFVIFSSPIEKLKEKLREYYRKKRRKQIQLYEEGNRKMTKEFDEKIEKLHQEVLSLAETQKNFHDSYTESQGQFHAYVESSFDEIHASLHQLEDSDREQLRQLMDHIYYRYVNEKKIPQHKFDRYQGLYENYKREKGNGKYDAQWAELQKWERYTGENGEEI